jgi:signal transduction histidine kinase
MAGGEKKTEDDSANEFIYLASHQLRNPITSIRWAIDALAGTETMSERDRQYVGLIHNSAATLNDLVSVLLSMSRIEQGNIVFSPRALDVVLFVERLLSQYKPFFQKKSITILFQNHPESLAALLDSGALHNIIQPLISNAIEYTPEKGKIEVSLKKQEDKFLFTITDTGIGIPEKDKEHIFDKFKRGSNVANVKKEGFGLGLYTAVKTVGLLKGKIWFDSTEEKGTTFYVELPLETPTTTAV